MASFIDRNGPVIEEFRANNGTVEGRKFPVLLLTTTGRKTGAKHVSPMAYQEGDNALYVFASRGGAPNHPHWYLNLVANPDVTVEVGGETYEAIRATLVLIVSLDPNAAAAARAEQRIAYLRIEIRGANKKTNKLQLGSYDEYVGLKN